MTRYEELHAQFSKIYDLMHVSAIANWDEAAMMPVGGGPARGRALSTLSVVIHDMLADSRMPDWIEAAGTVAGG